MKRPDLAERFVSLAGNTSVSQTDTLTFSFASSMPIERIWGTEVLEISASAIDLGRFTANAVPFLWNHDRDAILGRATKAWIQGDRAYCSIQWADTPFAAEKRALVEGGILTGISCAYSIIDSQQQANNVVKVTRWEVLEVSLVSIPADAAVGIGRGFGEENSNYRSYITVNELHERDRVLSIQALGKRHSQEHLAAELIERGVPIEAARSAFLERISGHQQPIAAALGEQALLGLSHREQNSYSMSKAILAAATGEWRNAGLERECHNTLSKRQAEPAKGVLIPVSDLLFTPAKAAQRDQLVFPATAGGRLVATDLLPESFIDALRNRTQVFNLGARQMSGLVGNVDVSRRTSSSRGYWISENADITLSESAFDLVSLRPKTLGALTKISRLLLLQSTPDAEQLVRDDLAQILAIELDRAAIAGTGAASEPIGILNTPGINSVVGGANGAAPTWANLVALETEIATDNADVGSLGYLTNAKVRGKLKTTEKSVSTAEFIWGDMPGEPGAGMVNGYRVAVSNQVPSNLTKGTGTGLSAVIFGNWADLLIGQWGSLEVIANPYGDTDFSKGRVAVRAMLTADIQVRHPESFSLISDLIS